MDPKLSSSCPTPWKDRFLTEIEADERAVIVTRYYGPQRSYLCPFEELSPRGGMSWHWHLTSIPAEEAY